MLNLFIIFAKIGFLTIGGGYALVPLMQQTLSEAGLMTLQETIDMVGISQMTPGPLAVNAATFAGMRMGGVLGAAVATFGVTLPCFSITLLVSRFFFSFNNNPHVKSVLSGVRPVVVGLILASAITVTRTALWMGQGFDWASAILAGLCFGVLLIFKKVQPVLLIIICGIFGALFL